MPIFSGFYSGPTGPVQVLHDEELVKQDLINHFSTHKGERLMEADYGFIGWDLIFELKVPGTLQAIENDCRRIIKSEPRVTEQSINVVEAENGFTVYISLIYNYSQTPDTLEMFFDQSEIEEYD